MICLFIANFRSSKNNLVVAVWDVSKRMKISDVSDFHEARATGWTEGELCQQYKKQKLGKLPPLNIQDPSKSSAYRGGIISKSVWNLFQVDV